jgi:hypothetical protein
MLVLYTIIKLSGIETEVLMTLKSLLNCLLAPQKRRRKRLEKKFKNYQKLWPF